VWRVTTILVIEDEPDIRDLIRITLELGGMDVLLASDGSEGLATATAQSPDAIVLDVMMPGIDGWEVLSRLKEVDGPVSGVPVVMLTARTGALDQIRGGIEGAVRYMTKPFNPADLRDTLLEVLEGAPESVQRRRAQHQALTALARVEGGRPAGDTTTAPRPRLSRLDGAPISRARSIPPTVATAQLESLSTKQRELIAAVASSPTVIEAADRLEVSRSNVYASLRRIARKLGVATVSDLVVLARSGGLS
jgi:DNA-binding response OmpR family regulator/DNA-binding CsgD family transcriptional regulator